LPAGTPAEQRAYRPLYKAIYDTAYAPAREFAAEMRRSGAVVHAIRGDITAIWFNDLAVQWRRRAVPIAGLTAPEALFCLEQLAWDHRMRVVFRVTHRRGSNGVIIHQVRAPEDLLRHVEPALNNRPDWGASVAELANRCLQGPTAAGGDRIAATRLGDAQGLPLVSWVIAPVDRHKQL
jgi:hypothetical protein